MNSGDGKLLPVSKGGSDPEICPEIAKITRSLPALTPAVEAQDGVSLAQFPVALERTQPFTGVKVLVMFGDDYASRFEQT